MTRTTRMAVLGLCRTAITSTSAMIVFVSACQSDKQKQHSARPSSAPRSRLTTPQRSLATHAILHSLTFCPKRAIAKTSLVVDELGTTSFLVDADGWRDRGAFLALLELEKCVREKGFGSDFVFKIEQRRRTVCWVSSSCTSGASAAKRSFKDFKLYTVPESAELSVLNVHTHASDSEPTICRSINVHKLRQYVIGAEGLSTAQETERGGAFFRAYTAALRIEGAITEMKLPMAARFKEFSGEYRLPWKAFHVATLTQENVVSKASRHILSPNNFASRSAQT
ncbi:hypothetical protein DFH11DRAFT_1830905 [Phellopilus nigrolimitatus]|nr:hypothetical protein DFH11DRAFT_1830905 [Phellopilus nigrolimitatus]